MSRFRKSAQGFTLVEVLVVVAILGILAAIVIPQFTKYKRNAALAQCNADLRNCMSEAAARYANNSADNNETCKLPGNRFADQKLICVKFGVNETTGAVIISSLGTCNGRAEWSGIEVNYNVTDNHANCTLP